MSLTQYLPVPNRAPQVILGTTAYYRWRLEDFKMRHKHENEYSPRYYLTYGEKYADRFYKKTRKQLSERGKKWLDSTLLELQLIMEHQLQADPSIEYDPDRFVDFAFQSHVHAYQKTGFFQLPLKDIRLVLLTLDFKDSFVNRKGRRQIIDISTRFFGTRFTPRRG